MKARLSDSGRTNSPWLSRRLQVLRHLQSQVRKLLGPEPRDIQIYAQDFEREFKKRWQVSDKKELMEKILAADIVYGSDFHAFAQVQRTHLKILRAIPRNRPVTLALEAFSVSSQAALNAYLKGDINEKDLLKLSHWQSNWGFPWESYRPLLELARMRGYRILALSAKKRGPDSANLHRRDSQAARVLVADQKKNPRHLQYVIFGELHLASSHLPARVKSLIKSSARKKSISDLMIYVNSERIYFQLAKRGLESQVDVVRLSRRQYCVMSSPPWVQWQSYLLFLEKNSSFDSFFEMQEGENESDLLVKLIELLESDLSVSFKHDDIAVYATGHELLDKALARSLSANERKVAQILIKNQRGFFVPKGGLFYVAKTHINQLSELAGRYVHAKLCKQKRTLWKMPRDWKALIWSEAVAFFMSKLINHKRQSHTLTDLRAEIVTLANDTSNPARSDQGREVLLLALDQRLLELMEIHQGRKLHHHLRPVHPFSYFESARILGSMLGERLYLMWRSRKISLRTLRIWFSHDLEAKDFSHFYDEVVLKLEPVSKKVKSKQERL